MVQNLKIKALGVIILCTAISWNAHAGYISNGYVITSRSMQFQKNTLAGKCNGTVSYPELLSDADTMATQINMEIVNFVKGYKKCDVNSANKYSVTFDVPFGSADYFSVRWYTKLGKELHRVDALTFYPETGELVEIVDILNPLANNYLPKIVKLSKNILNSDITWEQFLDKIDQRTVQFYIKDATWYLVFNPEITGNSKKVIEVKLPDYLVKDNYVTSSR